MIDVFIGIGGNLGDREASINEAIRSLSGFLTKIECSGYYKTEPRDYLDQDYFINVVVRGKTDLSPFQLLKKIQAIEKGGGRIRDKKIPKGPRTIDLDILLYGNVIVDNEQLRIPHFSMRERRFVLIPLLEIGPDLFDHEKGIPFFKYLDTVEDQGVYCSSLNDYNNLFL